MCQMCHSILRRLLTKGLISNGNVKMCEDEITHELEAFETESLQKLTTEQLQEMQRSITGSGLVN